MTPLILSHYTATTCLGHGLAPMAAAMREGRGGLARCAFETVELDTCVGEIAGVDGERVPAPLREFDCRNNRLAHLALRQDGFDEAVRATIARVGRRRFGLYLGTSTSGILETEIAYRHRDPVTGALPAALNYRTTHNTFSVAAFVRELLGVEGPTAVISTACSSSAKAFGAAQRMIEAGVIDAALVGGVDSLCLTTLYGFHSLQLTSAGPCRPFATDRDGISIGEGAAFAVLERAGPRSSPESIALLGVGESNDAYHLSSPHPDGLGARLAMEAALATATLEPGQIDYVNVHGTATPSNDRAESCAIVAVLGAAVPCSSTKGATGHTLGAAGAVEVVACAIAIQQGFMPGGINTAAVDPALCVNYLTATRSGPLSRVLTNSFGFGGTNCSLVLGRLP
ncbi:MAG TPA: beta-ketoacyl-[acyl-carrier-protein] synthase family protein [Steroidobacteraceae bacterium]|nr:beta-ketoacyl-[acyl-carrier-protein] synthase family protein [Steroidobacteraceae bacterium]